MQENFILERQATSPNTSDNSVLKLFRWLPSLKNRHGSDISYRIAITIFILYTRIETS